MAPLTCPVCAAPVRQGDLICINCGANLARREAPPAQQPYPSQQDQQPGPYQPQEQSPYAPQQPQYPPQDQQPYGGGPQQPPYPPQQDYQQQSYPPPGPQPYQPGGHDQPPYGQRDQQPYAAPSSPDPSPYGQRDQQPYGAPSPQDQQRQAPYAPPQGQQPYGAPPQQDAPPYGGTPDQGYGAPQQPYGGPPQQQGYGGGYGGPAAPHVPPPPREPTMTGGESTAAFTPFCPHCGADIPDIGNPVCVQCLRPLNDPAAAGGAPQQLTVFVQFSSGEVQVGPGQELVLGRDPVQSPVASTFSRFDNVSRRHATIGIDGAGQAWVRDERSTNGTFVNDRRLSPGEQAPLRDGDSLRLAADARGQVRFSR